MSNKAKKWDKAKMLKLLGITLCVFGFFMAINTSYANVLTDIAGKSIIDFFSWGISIVLYILSTIFASILMIGGWVFDWTLNLNSAILDNPAVRVGWPIARDITNLGFVLLILVIAFSTILQMGSFTAKKALPKLIIAALLINFSLLFVGIFLDFCGIITNFFINTAITGSGSGVGISQAIIGMMHIVNILQPPATFGAESWTTFGAGMLTFIANLFFINIITAITAITMWAMAAMFLIRYVMLGLLIILMPLAILAWVLGRDEWGEWFKKLTQYAIFAPISSLFIYLAIATAQEFGAMQISAQQASVAPGLTSITANIGSMIMIIAILLFGLGLAEKASGGGGKIAVKMAEGAIKGVTKGTLSMGFKALGGAGLAKKASELGKNSPNTFWRGITRPVRQISGDTSAGLKKYPGIMTGLTEGIAEGWGGKSRAFRMKEEKEFEEKTKKEKVKNDKLTAKQNEAKIYQNELASINSEQKDYQTQLIRTRAEIQLNERMAASAPEAKNPPEIAKTIKENYAKQKEALLKQAADIENKIKERGDAANKRKQELNAALEKINKDINEIKKGPDEATQKMEDLAKKVAEIEEKSKEEKSKEEKSK